MYKYDGMMAQMSLEIGLFSAYFHRITLIFIYLVHGPSLTLHDSVCVDVYVCSTYLLYYEELACLIIKLTNPKTRSVG